MLTKKDLMVGNVFEYDWPKSGRHTREIVRIEYSTCSHDPGTVHYALNDVWAKEYIRQMPVGKFLEELNGLHDEWIIK